MAKTKQDYIVEGAKLFKNYKYRPEGNSWQVKAMQEGWDFEDRIFQKQDQKKNIIHPALMHIEFLKNEAFKESNGSKFVRYIAKYSKLKNKWAKRGIMF